MKRSLVVVLAFAVVSCSGRVETDDQTALDIHGTRIVKTDDRPAFAIDRSQQFCLMFGRGSGWYGLDTIKADQTGQVVVHRIRREYREKVRELIFETVTLQLSPAALDEVLTAVEKNDLIGLAKAYSIKNLADGTQWVFWFKQGEHVLTAEQK